MRASSLIVIIIGIKGKKEIWHCEKLTFVTVGVSVFMCVHASVYIGGFCCYFGSQCPNQVWLSEPPLLLSKKTLAPSRLRKTPHPPKPPHVPFPCLRLLHSHDPLTKASSPVEYHMFLVKPNFFFSSFKTSICQAKSIEKAPLLPFFLSPPPPRNMSQNISNRWGFKLIYSHNKRAKHFNSIVSNFKLIQ